MELKIRQIENGYIVKYSIEIEEGKFQECEEVFEDNDMDEDECLSKLLYYVGDYFGRSYDKYGKDNLNINFNKKGHKLE